MCKVYIFNTLSRVGFLKSNLLSFNSFLINCIMFIPYSKLSSISIQGYILWKCVCFGASQVSVLNHNSIIGLRTILDYDNLLIYYIVLYIAADIFLLDHFKKLVMA